MNCPKCKKEMVVKNQDTSHNAKNQKGYKRVIYRCGACDVWVDVEIPEEK